MDCRIFPAAGRGKVVTLPPHRDGFSAG